MKENPEERNVTRKEKKRKRNVEVL